MATSADLSMLENIKRGHRRSAIFTSREFTTASTDEPDEKKALPTVSEDESSASAQLTGASAAMRDTHQREQALMKRMAGRHIDTGKAVSKDSGGGDGEEEGDKKKKGKGGGLDMSKAGPGSLTLQSLLELKAAFEKVDVDGSGALDMDEFVGAFKSVRSLAKGMDEEQLVHLFMKIDANSDGTVDWDEFTNHLLLEQARDLAVDEGDGEKNNGGPPGSDGAEIYLCAEEQGQGGQGGVRKGNRSHGGQGGDAKDKASRFLAMKEKNKGSGGAGVVPHNAHHTDMIERVMLVPPLAAYISAGRDGVIWSWNADKLTPNKTLRNSAGWITDLAYMSSQPLAVCSVDRTITFYDSGKSSRHPFGLEALARVNNLDNVPMSARYVRVADFDMLLWGDDRGFINSYTFDDFWGGDYINPGSGIEMGNKKLPGMKANTPFKLHSDWVTKLMYLNHSGCLVTSSMDSTLRMVDLERKKPKWTVDDHMRGVYSFDFCRTYNFIASCGVERQVLLWNPFTGRSVGALYGHSASVQDVVVSETENQLMSLATDKVMKVWDIRSHKCLQTITDQAVYWPENRISAMTHDPARRVIITAGTKLKQWYRVTKENVGIRPVTSAIYNSAFRQVVAGDSDGSISVWSIDRGESVFTFADTHPDTQLSAMVFDASQRRMITCARDGTVRMWNFNNGQCLKNCEGFGNSEVSCVTYLEEGPNRFIAAAGWNQEVCIWVDGPASKEPVHHCLKPPEQDKDDIISVEFCPPSIVATGFYNGKIMLWKIDGVVKSIINPPNEDTRSIDSKPIEQMMYMPNRGKVLAALCADANVYFWRLVDCKLMYTLETGHQGTGAAMCTNQSNTTLYTGDSLGFVYRWDLAHCDWRRDAHAAATQANKQRRDSGGRPSKYESPIVMDNKVSLVYGWRAHKQALVSLQHVNYKDTAEFVVTGSTDGRVRLWSEDGCHVGTFGLDLWYLNEPASYVGDAPVYQLRLDNHVPVEDTKKKLNDLLSTEDSNDGEDDGEELSAEDYEKLIMGQRRLALLDKKKHGKTSNPFSTILDRRLDLKEIAPVEAPLANLKRHVSDDRATAKSGPRGV